MKIKNWQCRIDEIKKDSEVAEAFDVAEASKVLAASEVAEASKVLAASEAVKARLAKLL